MDFIKLNFEKWTVTDLTNYQLANENDDFDSMNEALSRLIEEWSFAELDPRNPVSYTKLGFLKMMSVFKAIGRELKESLEEWASPKIKDTGITLDLNRWSYPEFRDFQKAQQSGDMSKVQGSLYKVIVSIDGSAVTEADFNQISVLKYTRVMGALFREFKALSTEGN